MCPCFKRSLWKAKGVCTAGIGAAQAAGLAPSDLCILLDLTNLCWALSSSLSLEQEASQGWWCSIGGGTRYWKRTSCCWVTHLVVRKWSATGLMSRVHHCRAAWEGILHPSRFVVHPGSASLARVFNSWCENLPCVTVVSFCNLELILLRCYFTPTPLPSLSGTASFIFLWDIWHWWLSKTVCELNGLGVRPSMAVCALLQIDSSLERGSSAKCQYFWNELLNQDVGFAIWYLGKKVTNTFVSFVRLTWLFQ